MSGLFRGAYDGEVFSLAGLDMSKVTSVNDMLSDNPNLKSIDLTGADISSLSVSSTLSLLMPNTIQKVDTSEIPNFGGTLTYADYQNNIFSGKTSLKELIIPNIN
jgi:hypothetical protein